MNENIPPVDFVVVKRIVMAAAVEMSQASVVMSENSNPSDGDNKPDVNEKGMESGGDGNDKGNGKKELKPKIFDKKNFVEAPLPKTNPWTKRNASGKEAIAVDSAPPQPGKKICRAVCISLALLMLVTANYTKDVTLIICMSQVNDKICQLSKRAVW